MKIVLCSDLHADWTTAGVDRFPEIAKAAHEAADRAIAERASVFAFLGDLCNPDSGSCVFRAVGLAMELATKLYLRGVSSIWLAGNHDVIETGRGDTSLTPLRALEMLPEAPGAVYVVERPAAIEISMPYGQDDRQTVRFVCLPFTASSHGYEADAAIIDLAEGSPKQDTVILSHLHVAGVEPGEESGEMARGREHALPVALAMEKAAAVFQGHYHRQQKTKDGVWIVGSPARLTFSPGIEEHRPGFLSAVI